MLPMVVSAIGRIAAGAAVREEGAAIAGSAVKAIASKPRPLQPRDARGRYMKSEAPQDADATDKLNANVRKPFSIYGRGTMNSAPANDVVPLTALPTESIAPALPGAKNIEQLLQTMLSVLGRIDRGIGQQLQNQIRDNSDQREDRIEGARQTQGSGYPSVRDRRDASGQVSGMESAMLALIPLMAAINPDKLGDAFTEAIKLGADYVAKLVKSWLPVGAAPIIDKVVEYGNKPLADIAEETVPGVTAAAEKATAYAKRPIAAATQEVDKVTRDIGKTASKAANTVAAKASSTMRESVSAVTDTGRGIVRKIRYDEAMGRKDTGKLLNFIGGLEATTIAENPYESAYPNTTVPGLEDKTLAEVKVIGKQRAQKYGSSAMGRYQFMYETLFGDKGKGGGLVDQMNLPMTTKFDRQTQEKLGNKLLQRRGLDKFKSGEISERQFAHNLSKEWASLPDPMNGNRSFYADDKIGNKSLTSMPKAFSAIRSIREFGTSPVATTPERLAQAAPPRIVPVQQPSTVVVQAPSQQAGMRTLPSPSAGMPSGVPSPSSSFDANAYRIFFNTGR
jgi:muramidase (phage lysozyme)